MFRLFYRQLLCFVFISLFSTSLVAPVTVAQAQIMRTAEEVMQLHVSRDNKDGLQLQWTVAPNVYIYRDKIAVEMPDGSPIASDVSEGVIKDDINFGSTEVLFNRALARVSVDNLPKTGSVLVRWQGCEEDSICYPPVTKSVDLQSLQISKVALGFGNFAAAPQLDLDATEPAQTQSSALTGSGVAQSANQAAGQATNQPAGQSIGQDSDQSDDLSAVLSSNLGLMLAAFFGFGLLLALTPCVFPMIPILSGMLARSGDKLSAGRGFVLSSAYVIAMAGAYAVLGFAASWSGYNLQAALQTPYALGFMALIFVLLAFSMFGYYELKLPAAWTSYFNRHTSGGNGGAITGALLLGFGSALIVGPCVTPPLAAALLYVAKTGDALRGASALFALGLGMGVPLIIFGTFGAKFLPKSGPWLKHINQIFGIVFLGLAVVMILRLLSDENAILVLAVCALAGSVFLGVFDKLPTSSTAMMRVEKTTGVVALIYGTLLLVGFAGGASDPWRPLGFLQAGTSQSMMASQISAAAPAITVKTSSEYDQALKTALASGKPVLVDFTADWCTICKTNDKILHKPEFADRLGNLTTIKADITDYTEHSRELMQRFNVVGPPTLMFLEASTGTEQSKNRIIGELTSQKLDDRLRALGL